METTWQTLFSGDLERVISGLTSSDANNVLHVIDKDLSIADVAGMQSRICGGDDQTRIYLGNDNVNLKLGNQMHAHFNAAVLSRFAFLCPAPHHIGYRHPRHTNGSHGITQGAEALLITENPDKSVTSFPDRRIPQPGGQFAEREEEKRC